MTPDDLIIAIPWIIFGIGLSAIGFRLLGARHAARPGPGKGEIRRRRPGAAQLGAEPVSHPVQEDQRPESNTEAHTQ
jgi:hypothetical protein